MSTMYGRNNVAITTLVVMASSLSAATTLTSVRDTPDSIPASPSLCRAPIPRPPRHVPKHQAMARKARL